MLGALVHSIAHQDKRKARSSASDKIDSASTRPASSPASRPRRPASCISAARAPRCSTGCSPATTAASSCCGSRIPTRRARPRKRSTRSSTACAGSGSIGTAHEYYQSQFWARHAEVAHQLLERGARLSLLHDPGGAGGAARDRRRPSAGRSASTARGATSTDEQGDKPFVIRLKAPREGETVIDDLVQGRVTVAERRTRRFRPAALRRHADLHAGGGGRRSRHGRHPRHPRRRPSQQRLPPAGDHPRDGLARADLRPCPADPRPRRRQAQQAPRRARASTPIATSSASCPKRSFNYLLRLGWGHGDDEIISRDQAIEWFDLDHVGKSPSRFDLKKLENLNGHYIREADDARLADLVAPQARPRRRGNGRC